jgi:hypothetical protein
MGEYGMLRGGIEGYAMAGESPDDWLTSFYETGNQQELNRLIGHYWPLLDRFLGTCKIDLDVRGRIIQDTMHLLRESRKHPELHWDTRRGKVDGFMFGIVGHLMYRWLVWFEDPRDPRRST